MGILDTDSLAGTLDALNEAFFYGRAVPKAEREQVAGWIAGRQGLAGSYKGMFAATERDLRDGVRVFSGDSVRSWAGASHILSQEACRALILLKPQSAKVRQALARAVEAMRQAVGGLEGSPAKPAGIYCCGKCSCSMWRHLCVSDLPEAPSRLSVGLTSLKTLRDGAGQWRRFPFYYTLLALLEIDSPLAVAELRYAAAICERAVKRNVKAAPLARRRRDILERALARC